jgi:FXSXX-COOH protein
MRESGVESEVVDLSAVSMTTLRELDDTVFRQALRHVMEQTAHQRVAANAESEQATD